MIFAAFDPVFILIRFEPISLLMKNELFFLFFLVLYIQRDPDGNKFLNFSGYPLIMDVLCNLYTFSAYHCHQLNSFIHSWTIVLKNFKWL